MLLFAQAPHTAVAAPRFHHQWLPDDVKLEQDALPAEVQQQLKNLGYVLKPIDMIGRAEALKRAEDGTWQAGADPRGDDTALSW
jgi:gamma-glutamyltranspeptidase/glutathione hydrolase